VKNPHDRNDRFGLLLHRKLAWTIQSNPGVLARAPRNILHWQAMHGHSIQAWEEWLWLLDAGADAVLKACWTRVKWVRGSGKARPLLESSRTDAGGNSSRV
jgi:hypothetical protein